MNKKTYIDGILEAYSRVWTMIENIDPEEQDVYMTCIKKQIEAAIYGYQAILEAQEKTKNEVNGYKEYLKKTGSFNPNHKQDLKESDHVDDPENGEFDDFDIDGTK